jgi:hypothetical protein
MSATNRPIRHRETLFAVLLTLFATLALLSVGVGDTVAQTAGNASAMNTTTGTSEASTAECHPDGPPPIQRVWLQREDKQVAAGDPAKIAFVHNLRTTYDCPVTVIATIYAPDGVELKMSSGGTVSQVEGAAQATYRIDPTTGGTLESSAIEVYYDGPVNGKEQIEIDATAQIFPADHRDDAALYAEVSGLSESVVVTEQTTPTPSNSSGDESTAATPTPTPTETTASAETPASKPSTPILQLPVLAVIALVALVAVVGAVASN